jgi:hypothetical protein
MGYTKFSTEIFSRPLSPVKDAELAIQGLGPLKGKVAHRASLD